MFGLGMPELIVILVIIVLIFGAGKLPEIGGAVGKAIKGFKKSVNEPTDKEEAQKKEDDGKSKS
jgi:sec-independent protein translocase protein TatA